MNLAAASFFVFLFSAAADTNQAAGRAEIAPELRVADRSLLAIPKAGFGKDYLFTASDRKSVV